MVWPRVWPRSAVGVVLWTTAAVILLGDVHAAAAVTDAASPAAAVPPTDDAVSSRAVAGGTSPALHELERDAPNEIEPPALPVADADADADADAASAPCNCLASRHQTRRCRYTLELTRRELQNVRDDLAAAQRERSRLDASVRGLVADRVARDASDAEWRQMMRVRVEAAAPRNESEKVWTDKQLRCLEEKYECLKERADRETALRDCLQSREPYATYNQPLAGGGGGGEGAAVSAAGTPAVMDLPVAGTQSSEAVIASLAAADLAIAVNTTAAAKSAPAAADASGAEAATTREAAFVWPSVTVVTPVCVKRHRWLPNLHRMWAHQNYPGPLQLLVADGRCSRLPEVAGVRNAYLTDAAARDPRVRYHFDDASPPPNIGAKRNWLARHATGDVVVTFDVDDYYAPSYVSRMVWLLTHPDPAQPDATVGMVKLHAWFSLGEGWLMNPPRRYKAWTYIDMAHDPLGWGWTYVYWRKVFDNPQIAFGEVDASEEAGFFHSLRRGGYTIATHADRWFLCLRIVTQSVVRTTGAGPCKEHARGCTNLPDFMVLTGFGGADQLRPWTDLWDARE